MKLWVSFWVYDIAFIVDIMICIENFQVKEKHQNKDKYLFNCNLDVNKQVIVVGNKDK